MKKNSTYKVGVWAEYIASFWLLLKGYRILARRLKTPHGEIDLLAQRGRILIVVEVKFRNTYRQAIESIQLRQRHRIHKALLWWMHKYHRQNIAAQLRFDVIVVLPWSFPSHLKDAWRPGE